MNCTTFNNIFVIHLVKLKKINVGNIIVTGTFDLIELNLFSRYRDA